MRFLASVLIALVYLSANPAAVGKDKVLYIGGTLRDFPARRAVRITVGAPKVEGTISTKSDDRIVFNTGSESLEIPYAAMTALHYGPDGGRPAPRGLILTIPWEATEQFTKDVHQLLTVVFTDTSGNEHAAVFELGSDLVRPTLEALERRSGKTVAFQDVDACTRYKTRDECGYGSATELKGLKKIAVDPGIRSDDRDLILAALKAEQVGLEVLDSLEGAEIILKFVSMRSPNPECPCEGGRGEVVVLQGTRERVVLLFANRKMGIRGKKPAIDFGATFVAAFKSANGMTK